MPRFLVKVSPARDAYIEWSTVTDSPVGIGSRQRYAAEFGEERLARVDAVGTSARWYGWLPDDKQEGGWTDECLYVSEGAERPGELPRSRLGDLYDMLSVDINAPIPAAWVTPFEE